MSKVLHKGEHNFLVKVANMEKLKYIKFKEEDFKYYEKLCFNEEVMKMNFGRVFTMEETKKTFAGLLKADVSGAAGYYKVYEAESRNYIGLGAMTLSDDQTEAEIEYIILPDFWGKGYGTEIAEKMIAKATEVKTVGKITAYTGPENVRSQKILKSHGFKIVRKFITSDDNEAEELVLKL